MSVTELLAPVGTFETFQAALDGGADAVYVGAPGLNARNPAKELVLEQIGAMIQQCHALGKKLYIAANSILLEHDLPSTIKSLAILQELGPDGLIVQDLALLQLVKKYFPKLPLHGSTLMGVHNSDGVRLLGELGYERVVLARELTLKEIETISRKKGQTELEIFIHGAMCFSYSGFCLFSSYLGGKSGLRGKCVQPCRRAYSSERQSSLGKNTSRKRSQEARHSKGRYLFSMNDLNGLEIVPFLKELGISSLKIEGRLRSPHYVNSIVSAYRLALDATPNNQEEQLIKAQNLAQQALSRTTATGYFLSPQPQDAITPHHSGNMGLHLGKFSTIRKVGSGKTCRFVAKGRIQIGDRLRLHLEPSGERTAFRLKTLFVAGEDRKESDAGERVSLALPADFELPSGSSVDVYKSDGPLAQVAEEVKDFEKRVQNVRSKIEGNARKTKSVVRDALENSCFLDRNEDSKQQVQDTKIHRGKESRRGRKKVPMEWWLRTDSAKTLLAKLPFTPDRYLLSFEKQTVAQAGSLKSSLGRRARMISWALPPVIHENDLNRARKQIKLLIQTGYRSFQIGHLSQLQLFEGEKVHLFGDYTLNLTNSQAALQLAQIGLNASQAAIELDHISLQNLLEGYKKGWRLPESLESKKLDIGLTVFGSPPLYTSRLAAKHFSFNQQVNSPRNEPYIIKKKEGYTQTIPAKPFSLLPYLEELKGLGIGYGVVDISGLASKREIMELKDRLHNTGRYSKLSTFNYLGKLE